MMDISNEINPELWKAVSNSYENNNFSHAIRDAMVLLTETLRNKSGLDGDGDSLVGRALGFGEGKLPLIRINKLQTETEQNEQKGLMLILKGMYSLIRNPRSHERIEDTKETADRIILFIDYVMGLLAASKQTFTIQDFINQVTERYFVRDQEYVEELVSTIPVSKLGDTLIELYRIKDWNKSDNIYMAIEALLFHLEENRKADFLSVVSDDLMRLETPSEVSLVVKLLPDELWERLDKKSRFRAENMLFEDLDNGWYDPSYNWQTGLPSTWIRTILHYLLRKNLLEQALIRRLQEQGFYEQNFVVKYFLNDFPYIFDTDVLKKQCVKVVADTVRGGNKFVKDELIEFLCLGANGDWVKLFSIELADLTDTNNPEILLPKDGIGSDLSIPFLGKFVERPNPMEGEIPF